MHTAPWDPWAWLITRPDVTVVVGDTPLPATGLAERLTDGTYRITLDRSLLAHPAELEDVLTHEAGHIELALWDEHQEAACRRWAETRMTERRRTLTPGSGGCEGSVLRNLASNLWVECQR